MASRRSSSSSSDQVPNQARLKPVRDERGHVGHDTTDQQARGPLWVIRYRIRLVSASRDVRSSPKADIRFQRSIRRDGPQADIPGALTATHEDHCAATTSIWLVRCGRQHGTIHATSSFIALTIRTASGSVRPRTLISCTGKALISTPAVVATISDTTS